MSTNYNARRDYFHIIDIRFVRYEYDLLTILNNTAKYSREKF